MAEGYIPTTEDVRQRFALDVDASPVVDVDYDAALEEFDRWLTRVQADAVSVERERCARAVEAEDSPFNHVLDTEVFKLTRDLMAGKIRRGPAPDDAGREETP